MRRYQSANYSHPEPAIRSSGAGTHLLVGAAPAFAVGLSKETARAVFVLLLAVELCFGIVHGLLQIYLPSTSPWLPLRDLFDLDLETSIPTWFSATQLAAIALLLVGQAAKRPDWRKPIFLLSAVFAFLSLDEGASIHDTLYLLGRDQPTLRETPFLAWMVPYSCLAVILLRVLWKPLLRARQRAPLETALVSGGAVIFATGGVVLEIVSTYIFKSTGAYLPFIVSVVAEEVCEMAGVTIMLYAFMLVSSRTSVATRRLTRMERSLGPRRARAATFEAT